MVLLLKGISGDVKNHWCPQKSELWACTLGFPGTGCRIKVYAKWNFYGSYSLLEIYMVWICSDNNAPQASANCFFSHSACINISEPLMLCNIIVLTACCNVQMCHTWITETQGDQRNCPSSLRKSAAEQRLKPDGLFLWKTLNIELTRLAAGMSIPKCNTVFCCRACLWFSYVSFLLIPSAAIQGAWGISMQRQTVVGNWTEQRTCRDWKGVREWVNTQQPVGEIIGLKFCIVMDMQEESTP